ncbi:arsenosugar biosynthesis radical SAM protein ArsS [Parvimonas micra]|uniref:arsenosugar biosynthesis radical SAM (seleno)protein ArsS n=1 Tax=Parvimonas micra TaxID=33033 RepID=UPI001E387C38|nr:arsenosugar biosynthesis radical SAM (seleno)protein ArsS [Parvimonas micra]MCE3019358.1 arsenosugar biosynthesis radical SAM protein ArsS [Parvimonas micra]
MEYINYIPKFFERVENKNNLYTTNMDIMQLNIGKICNLACKHCHVEAGPHRKEYMSKEIMDDCLYVFKKHGFKIMDITGGAPEMMPNFEYLVEESSKIAKEVIVRTNLCILLDEKYKHLIDFYAKNKVTIFCSLPFYTKEITDGVRGEGVYESSIEVLKKLNDVGYGKTLTLNLVYNPDGAFLPDSQECLEKEYRTKLLEEYGIVFTNLFAITNNPIGRFGMRLYKKDKLKTYMTKLYNAYNEDTVEFLMCRNEINVSYDGYIYDCDFNQALDLKINSSRVHISDYKENNFEKRKIALGNHCYGCTAGAGSS